MRPISVLNLAAGCCPRRPLNLAAGCCPRRPLGPLATTVLGQDGTFVEGDLSTRGHIFVVVVTLASLAYILRLVRRRRMGGRYALLWLGVGLVLMVLAVWPGLLTALSELVGVHYPPALFLLVSTGFLFVVVIHFSYELTKLEDRSRILAEEVALLRAERDLDDAAPRDLDG